MLESFTVGTFADRIGESFRIRLADDAIIETSLIEARTWGEESARGRGRTPFSLVFRGPAGPVLPQRIYSMEHAAVGRFDIFIVPTGPDAEGMRYEAVFT